MNNARLDGRHEAFLDMEVIANNMLGSVKSDWR
jgi:hypothetical protein